MKIINDQISLEPADIAQFSPAAQSALAGSEFGETAGRTYKESAEAAFNITVARAIGALKQAFLADVTPLIEALAVETDTGKRSQVAILIDQAKEVLDVKDEKDPAVSLNPTAEPAVQKTK